MIVWIWTVVAVAAAALSLPGTVELLLLVFGSLLPKRHISAVNRPYRVAVIVPAHNEEANISRTLDSLSGDADIFVVADNCTDRTAEIARERGARVLLRQDEVHRGKGYALEFAFHTLERENYDAFLIVDADTEVAPNFLVEMVSMLRAGADAVQARYLLLNPDESIRMRLTSVANRAFNVFRARGRDRLGLSCALYGNGFGISRETLRDVPYRAASIVEDLEYHLALVRAGKKVRFVETTSVYGETPSTANAANTQKTRWEGGRFRMIREQALPLFADMLRLRFRCVEPLLDLLLLPLAFHVMLLLVAAAAPLTSVRVLGIAGLSLVASHLLLAIAVGNGTAREVIALVSVPFYVLWKISLVPSLARGSRANASWTRTARNRATPVVRQSSSVSIVIVSFNTRDLLRECLLSLKERSKGIEVQIIVVDNASTDGSADMVAREFPDVRLIRSSVNIGFAAANNLAFPFATGRYIVLLNSDAFLKHGALQRAIEHMNREPRVGLGGARLVGPDGAWQPSARLFPSLVNDFFILSGLSGRFPKSRLFGRCDRTWAKFDEPADVDWVPGAFSIIRRDVLDTVGYFDERFFLYYEEVDLCRRIRNAGFVVRYWPDVVVVHLGGESSKTVRSVTFSRIGSQLHLWRMRSTFLYYRKHRGCYAWLVKEMELLWQRLRQIRNTNSIVGSAAKRDDSRRLQQLLDQAWRETSGGRISPARPW